MNELKKRKIYKVLFITWSVILFTLTSIPKLSVPAPQIVNIDKLAHAFVYLVFAWLFILMHKQTNLQQILRTLLLKAAVVPLFY